MSFIQSNMQNVGSFAVDALSLFMASKGGQMVASGGNPWIGGGLVFLNAIPKMVRDSLNAGKLVYPSEMDINTTVFGMSSTLGVKYLGKPSVLGADALDNLSKINKGMCSTHAFIDNHNSKLGIVLGGVANFAGTEYDQSYRTSIRASIAQMFTPYSKGTSAMTRVSQVAILATTGIAAAFAMQKAFDTYQDAVTTSDKIKSVAMAASGAVVGLFGVGAAYYLEA